MKLATLDYICVRVCMFVCVRVRACVGGYVYKYVGAGVCTLI